MELILMRHGRAEDRLEFARSGHGDDAQRPLTGEGRKRLSRSSAGLQQVVPAIDLVVTSPLLRARQSAEVLLERFPAPLKVLEVLSPGCDVQELTRWLGRQKAEVVLLIGHEPDLGTLASWYLTGSEQSFITLKKGGIALIHFDGKPAAAEGSLQLLLSAAQLRRMAS